MQLDRYKELKHLVFSPPTGGEKYRGDDGDSLEGVPGESTKQAGAPPRAERRMPPARPWRLRSCAFYLLHTGLRMRSRIRRSARPHLRVERKRASGAPAPS